MGLAPGAVAAGESDGAAPLGAGLRSPAAPVGVEGEAEALMGAGGEANSARGLVCVWGWPALIGETGVGVLLPNFVGGSSVVR